MIQGGAGTSTNMNANEVIANRALELLGHAKGEYQHLHPNDHVNCSQSTNDAYPTAIKLGVVLTLRDTLSAMRELRSRARGEGEGIRRRAEDGPHGKPGRRADDARPGVRRVCRDDRRRHPPPARAPAKNSTRSTWARPPSAPASTALPATPRSARKRLAEISGMPRDAGRQSRRGDAGFRRVRADEQHDEDRRRAALENLQRPALDVLRPALRPLRNPPARDAARLVDHARQGEPRDPRSRQPGLLPDHRLRRDRLDGLPRRASSS